MDRATRIAEVEGLGPSRLLPAEAQALPGEHALLLRRPEVLTPAEVDHAPNRLVPAVAEVVQFGDSALVIGRAGGVALRARIPGREAQGIEAGARMRRI